MKRLAVSCLLAAAWALALAEGGAEPGPRPQAEGSKTADTHNVSAVPPARTAPEAAAADSQPSSRPWVLDSTFAERIRASQANQRAKVESLALPHPHADNVMPGPKLVPAGRLATVYADLDWIVWQIVPTTNAHKTYLERRKDLLAEKDPLAVVDWCEGSALPACAEFELRRILFANRKAGDPAYQAALQRWLPYGKDRVAGYAFPLPVEGEWFVAEDTGDHHRAKAWSYHAVDLVIKHRGSMRRPGRGGCENYYAFGRPVLAQADGLVRSAEDKFEDLPPGKPGDFDKANTVIVDYGGGVQALYAHLRQGSLAARAGQRVSAGQKLAEVGNSGASSVPHLHYTLIDQAHFSLAGRYRMAFRRGAAWTTAEEGEIAEGTYVRNVKDAFAAAKK